MGGAAIYLLTSKIKTPNAPAANQNTQTQKTHFAYFMQSEFYTGINQPDKVVPLEGKVFGGIVSHHFYVERYIANFFSKLANQTPSVVVVIGPNHFSAGEAEIQVSKLPYQTPWGNLEPDDQIIADLLKSGAVQNEEMPFEKEHSISTLVGFIKHQFPQTKFVPIILKHQTSEDAVNKLAGELNKILPADALVIASVDFSHHVTNNTAKAQDKDTIPLIQNYNYPEILKRTSTEIDSPVSIVALLKYMQLRGATTFNYTNTNQALVSGNLDSQDVTSYVFGYFSKTK